MLTSPESCDGRRIFKLLVSFVLANRLSVEYCTPSMTNQLVFDQVPWMTNSTVEPPAAGPRGGLQAEIKQGFVASTRGTPVANVNARIRACSIVLSCGVVIVITAPPFAQCTAKITRFCISR